MIRSGCGKGDQQRTRLSPEAERRPDVKKCFGSRSRFIATTKARYPSCFDCVFGKPRSLLLKTSPASVHKRDLQPSSARQSPETTSNVVSCRRQPCCVFKPITADFRRG